MSMEGGLSVMGDCQCPYIGTNLDWVSFEKLTGFQGILYVLLLRFIVFFFSINCHLQSV